MGGSGAALPRTLHIRIKSGPPTLPEASIEDGTNIDEEIAAVMDQLKTERTRGAQLQKKLSEQAVVATTNHPSASVGPEGSNANRS